MANHSATIGVLFTAGVLLHNLEESVWLPGWKHCLVRSKKPVSPREFRLAAVLLSSVLVSLTGTAAACGASWLVCTMVAYALLMVVNAILPHLLLSIASRSYMPGTATALLLNVPLGLLYIKAIFAEQRVAGRIIIWACPLIAVGMALSLPLWFQSARWLLRRFPWSVSQPRAAK